MRVRRLLWLVIVFALVVAACGDDDADTTEGTTAATTATTAAAESLTKTDGVLTVGSDIPFPPFEDFDDAGNVIGFDAAVIEEMADRLGLTVEWVDSDWETIFTQLATGRYDVVASAVTITPERAQQVNFTNVYYNSQQALTVNTDLTPGLRSTASLGEGHTVAVQVATTGAIWAAENLGPKGVDIREFPGAPDTYNALEAGQVDGVIFDEPSAVEESANRAGLEVVEVIATNELYGFGVDPAREALLDQLNAALDAMVADGTYQTIYDEWFVAPAGSVLYEVAVSTLGTADDPIQVVFLPSASAEEIVAGGELLSDTLNASTGLFFDVAVPTSYAATIEAMCAAPDSTIGFISSAAFVYGDALCGMEMPLKSDRFGDVVYWTAFLVARDSDIETLADLDGKTWGVPDVASTSGYMVPLGMLKALGVTPSEITEFGGSHTATARGIYTGDVDFSTVYYNGYTDADGVTVWDRTAANADIPDEFVADCGLDADGQVVCSGLFPQDARRAIRAEAPDVIQKVRVLTLSDAAGIPNDGLAFPDAFPDDLQTIIFDALFAFQAADLEGFKTAFDPYSWDGIVTATDAEYDGIRAKVAESGVDLEDLN